MGQQGRGDRMTFEEKMKALKDTLNNKCEYEYCDDCEFFDLEDDTDGDYFCGIRDNEHKIPCSKGWNMKIALGLEEPYKPVFPEEVENSMMQHFTRVE